MLMDDDNTIIEAAEIDLEVAECGEILELHGVAPTVELVADLWDWLEQARRRWEVDQDRH